MPNILKLKIRSSNICTVSWFHDARTYKHCENNKVLICFHYRNRVDYHVFVSDLVLTGIPASNGGSVGLSLYSDSFIAIPKHDIPKTKPSTPEVIGILHALSPLVIQVNLFFRHIFHSFPSCNVFLCLYVVSYFHIIYNARIDSQLENNLSRHKCCCQAYITPRLYLCAYCCIWDVYRTPYSFLHN